VIDRVSPALAADTVSETWMSNATRNAWRLTSGSFDRRSTPISSVRIPNIRHG
jgi:hypothetical protein